MIIFWLFIFLFGCIIAVIFSFNALINTLRFGLPFVSTPKWAIEWLRDNYSLTEKDVVIELGCGSAPMLAAWAKKYPQTKFIGIEIQWWPYLLAKWRTRNFPNVNIQLGDFLKQDLSQATLIYGFFITVMMPKVAKLLEQQLHNGIPVISFGFALPGWTSEREITNPKTGKGSRIRMYRSSQS